MGRGVAGGGGGGVGGGGGGEVWVVIPEGHLAVIKFPDPGHRDQSWRWRTSFKTCCVLKEWTDDDELMHNVLRCHLTY